MNTFTPTESLPPQRRRQLILLWVGLAALYGLLLIAIDPLVSNSAAGYWFGNAALASFALIAMAILRFPLACYGLTWKRAGPSLMTGGFTAALLIAFAVGFLLFKLPPGTPLLSGLPHFDPVMIAYLCLSVPIQEWAVRGVVQGGVRRIYGEHRGRNVVAIGTSTLFYCVCHLPWGITTALVVVIPGILWGMQFERDKTLVGVIASHIVVGYLCVGVLPLWQLLIGR